MSVSAPHRRLGTVALVVRDYDEAIAYYTKVLGFQLIEDTPLPGEKRWVVVDPGSGGAQLLLAKAADRAQEDHIGDQTGGRVFLFLYTTNFDADFAALTERGVAFEGPPRREGYGTVAVFWDLYGNRWDLLQLNR
jgi:catechol 2,3-dioxygenase-like lactoylglutathione lyase family enzyme